jgi:hypothetical protein
MGHLSAEPRTGHCCHGFVRCPDHWLQPALCLRHCSAGSQTDGLDQRDGEPNRRMDCRADNRGLPLGCYSAVLVRDQDGIYGAAVRRRLGAMGIRDRPIARGSPWQNGFAERLIGSTRRECLDHVIVAHETHLRRILQGYCRYYSEIRTHRSLDKDAPICRPVQRAGIISSRAILGGLHHHYVRI